MKKRMGEILAEVRRLRALHANDKEFYAAVQVYLNSGVLF